MLRRLLMACAGLALLQTQAVAGTQYLGTITMYICDDGEDLCSNTLTSSPVILPNGAFTEDFVFDFVNDSPDTPNDVPLLRATAFLETLDPADFNSATVTLYDLPERRLGLKIIPLYQTGAITMLRTAPLYIPAPATMWK